MELSIIFTILLVHFIADFACQTTWMAENKSTDNKAMIADTLTYTMVLCVIDWKWAILNGFWHYIVDAISSQFTHALNKRKAYHWFFVVIGLDQLIHYWFLFMSYTEMGL